MADQSPSYRVPSDARPSYLNKDGLVGALAGALVIPPFTTILGLAAGSILGKRHMRHQLEDGKVVPPPSYANKELLIGAGLGFQAIVGLTLVGALVISSAATLGAIAIGATLAGAILGGRLGKKRMDREYNQATEYVEIHGEYNPTPCPPAHGQAPETTPSTAYQISPEEYAQLVAAQQKGAPAPGGMAEQVLANRSQGTSPHQR